MFQRKSGKFGLSLGKTTGWIHRQVQLVCMFTFAFHHHVFVFRSIEYQLLANAKVKMISDAQYESYSNHTLNVKSGDKSISLRFENVIVCAGQESVNRLAEEVKTTNNRFYLRLTHVKDQINFVVVEIDKLECRKYSRYWWYVIYESKTIFNLPINRLGALLASEIDAARAIREAIAIADKI